MTKNTTKFTFLSTALALLALLYLSSCGKDELDLFNRLAFESGSYTFEIAENVASGYEIGTVSVTDEEGNVAYSLRGTGSGNFEISRAVASGEAVPIKVAASAELDFEATTSYTLEVQVSNGINTATADVTITVTDVNDEAPAFANTPYAFSIASDAAGGGAVGMVSATDTDAGAMLTYLLSGEGSGNFAISNKAVASGVEVPVTVEANLSSLVDPVTMTITVDDGSNTADAEMEITINVGNATPVFANTPYVFNIAENATNGEEVGKVSATDANEIDTLTYTLSGEGAANFAISNTPVPSGEAVPITVAANTDLSSLASPVTITVTVTDNGTPALTADAEVEITIKAEANTPPMFAHTTYNFGLAEDAIDGAVVGTVAATDLNTGDRLTYEISGEGAADFAIRNTPVPSGEAVPITVAANADLSSLASPVTITVTVADNGTPALTADAKMEITINVGNVAPVFANTPYVFNIAENATNGEEVGKVSATDSNTGDRLTYEISGEGAANFAISNTAVASGEEVSVTVATGAALDYKTTPSYTLQVQVSDGGTPVLTDTETVEITIMDFVTAPVLTVSGTQTPLNEGTVNAETATGYTIGAVDEDGDGVTFTIEGDPHNRFAIANDSTLSIVAGSVFDHETEPTVTLTVTATDDNTGSLTDTEDVTITITDVATAPVISVSGTQTPMNEGTVNAETATGYTVTAVDEDGDGVVFSVGDNRFSIADDGTLNVVAGSVFDHETEPTVTLTVTATDDNTGALTGTETVEITIMDVETAPVLAVSGTQTPLNEGTVNAETATGYTIGAVDEDGDGVTFTIEGDPHNRFAIAGDGTLNIVAGSVFDYEDPANLSGIVTLTVTATDNSLGTLSSTETVGIVITDVATAPVITVSGSQTLVLNEGTVDAETATGYVVAATDEDEDGVAFSVSDPRFIVATNGMLNVVAGSVFDYETENPITLTVTATDDNFGSLTDMETVDDITIMDVIFSTMLSSENPGPNTNPAFGDVDGDGDMDLVVGETDGILYYYRWDGTGTDWRWGGGATNPFDAPIADVGFDIGDRSAPVFGDVDGDGDDDMLVGNGNGDLNFFRWDADTGWSNQTTTALDAPLSDNVGNNAFPAFGDVDGDGDDDLIIGNLAGTLDFYRWGDSSGGGTGWAKVTGSNNPFNGVDLDNTAPAFGDVDGDGDMDLLVGKDIGTLDFYRWGNSNGGGTGWTKQSGTNNPFDAPSDVDSNAAPAFGDIDGDGDMDLMIGEEEGDLNIYYWHHSTNTWSTTSDF